MKSPASLAEQLLKDVKLSKTKPTAATDIKAPRLKISSPPSSMKTVQQEDDALLQTVPPHKQVPRTQQ